MPVSNRSALTATVVVLTAFLGVYALLCWTYWDILTLGESLSATARNLSLIAGGFCAIVLALWRSAIANKQAVAAHKQVQTGLDQTAIAQQSLLCDRFQRGAEMLGHTTVAVRIGGIQALSDLAVQNMDRYYIPVGNLLEAFTMCPPDGGAPSGAHWSGDVQVATDALEMLRELRDGRLEATEVFDLVPDHPSSMRRPQT